MRKYKAVLFLLCKSLRAVIGIHKRVVAAPFSAATALPSLRLVVAFSLSFFLSLPVNSCGCEQGDSSLLKV